MVRFVPEQAATDAATAFERGERYLLGVYGFTTEVPAQTDQNLAVRMIEGTSDSRCLLLNTRTREYAQHFNIAMQERIAGP